MIFVTTGTQEPFDRLLLIIKRFAPLYGGEIVIQAKTDMVFEETNIVLHEFLKPEEFSVYFNSASLIVSHAGMGGIISALCSNKAILIFPRQLAFSEHRNDHQMSTARKMLEKQFVHVAMDEDELVNKLTLLIKNNEFTPIYSIGPFASSELIESMDEFIRF